MVPFFDNRADIIWKVLARDRFVNIGILPNDNSIKLNRAAKLGISVCSRITRLMNNPTKSQIKATIPQKKSKRREECCGSCENCTTIGLRLARVGSIGFSKGKTFPGKPGAKSLGVNSKGTVHPVYATSSKYLGKQRTIALKNTSQTSSSAKSLRNELRVPVPWRDWNTTATCPKHKNKLKEKDKATFHSPAEERVLPAASTKELEEREFVVDSEARMHMFSKRDHNTAELETLRTSRSPTTVMTANGEVQTR